jgi:Protein of unknown function (DUF5672)
MAKQGDFVYFFILGLFVIMIILCMIINKLLLVEGHENKEQPQNALELLHKKPGLGELPSYTAIIVEPREHPALEFVLTNVMANLDPVWTIIVFHGNKNEEFVRSIIERNFHAEATRIKMINLHVDNLTIAEYNKLFYTKSFYDHIPSETFLVFQTDSALCSKFKHNINEFLKYDYVGAPWKWSQHIGNGGLSLRKKSKMLEVLEKCPMDDTAKPEDVFFSSGCDAVTLLKPDSNTARNFSVETIPNETGTFGIHKPWVYLESGDYNMLRSECPEMEQVKMLQP